MLIFQVFLAAVKPEETKMGTCCSWGWSCVKALVYLTTEENITPTELLPPKCDAWSCSSHLTTMRQHIKMPPKVKGNERR
jgi:hypothetical protein